MATRSNCHYVGFTCGSRDLENYYGRLPPVERQCPQHRASQLCRQLELGPSTAHFCRREIMSSAASQVMSMTTWGEKAGQRSGVTEMIWASKKSEHDFFLGRRACRVDHHWVSVRRNWSFVVSHRVTARHGLGTVLWRVTDQNVDIYGVSPFFILPWTMYTNPKSKTCRWARQGDGDGRE